MADKGIVFDVQRYTIHDGPGLRTELFLKGCPLRCQWCSNPESWAPAIEWGAYQSKCISLSKCGLCTPACPVKGILNFKRDKLTAIDNSKQVDYTDCEKACPADAIKQWGKTMSVSECMTIICKDKSYYEQSGGGVTVSGGEALLQSEFVLSLFKACQKEGIQTCCETTFYADWKKVEALIPYTDIWISDIKHMDPMIHRQYTSGDNKIILENLKRLTDLKQELILRIPVIPNVNDDRTNIEATADFILNELHGRVRTLQLLSFMRLGVEKYQSLNIPYGMEGIELDREAFQEHVAEIAAYFNRRGIHCLVGTKEQEDTKE
ncbi:(2S)-3-sulfopropanediol dehydratase activating enzyme [Loigolactobacillus bifermentans]|jgi:pyruvate formate lyase activating enzyme|uniref:Pyruvate formate-lyase-activating enzyme n=1 Tax=Loigolactobacillus bifermentans DSM 20003 TaxID=1423726 RepID=A0A0R1GNK6_9LACO|nr:glycyl-radical enzyme activating protein [Loigolactobacillus bifermentans]KRK33300.1 pyruvate formate-lyase-activating enzyme [Loigolactobacillus bifermentans DSM 20003]QGG60852.1 glycyl-radical enzyme activating protein [Loigolactobacillus bifermentans]